MQFFAPDRSGIGCEIRPAIGESQQTIRRSARPAVARQCFLQQLPYKSIHGCVMLGGIDLSLADQTGR